MKKPLSLLLCAAVALSLLAGCGPEPAPGSSDGSSSGGPSSDPASSAQTPEVPRNEAGLDLMVLAGPTGIGASYLMEHFGPDNADFPINHTVAASNDEVTAALVNGDADVAAIATNMAANLYAKTEGGIQVLAVNTLGVLYILEKGDSVHSLADLAGKTVYAPSNTKGANPEHILTYLLEQNGVSIDQVDLQWLTPQEITVEMTSSDAGICMLPVPAATALMLQDSGVRQALSLSDVWEELDQGPLPMGCLVARTDYIQDHPSEVDTLLDLMGDSISFAKDNPQDAADYAAKFQIVPNAEVGAAAIPQCNLVLITGREMRLALESYYDILFQMAPASIGGGLPYDSFYYGVE